MLFLRRVSISRSVGGLPCAAVFISDQVDSESGFRSVSIERRYQHGKGTNAVEGPPPPPLRSIFRSQHTFSANDLVTFPRWNETPRVLTGCSKREHHARLFSDSALGSDGIGDETAEGEKQRKPSLFSYTGSVEYYDTADGVNEWCYSIKDVWAFGFDAEWDKKDVHSENHSPLALLQFVYVHKGEIKVAFIHVSKIKRMARPKTKEAVAGIPLALKQFLEDRGKHKAGCNLLPDVEKFQTHHAIKFRGLLDLDPGPNHRGIKKLMAILFRVKLHRNAALSIGKWSKNLSNEQVHFAATNAYAAFLVFRTFKHIHEAYFWQRLRLEPDPIIAAMLGDDSRVHHIRGW